MSVTQYGVNDALSNKLWSKKTNAEVLKQTYFGQFMGEDSNNMVQIQSDFEKSAGDALTTNLRVQLKGDGVTEGGTLQGNEEALSKYSDNFKINELAHATRARGKNTIDAQRVPFNLRQENKDGLRDWFTERFDVCMANHLCGNTVQTDMRYTGNNAVIAPAAGRIYRAAGATDDATIDGDSTRFSRSASLTAWWKWQARRRPCSARSWSRAKRSGSCSFTIIR